jgi:hypothetical protein
MNAFTDFCNISGMVDGTLFKLADLDLNLKAAGYSDEKSNPLNPPNALVRFKFMEMLVRIAKDKYTRNKITLDIGEAVQKLLAENVNPMTAKFNHMIWRQERYLCEEVDLVYKAYKPVLDTVFGRFSGRYTKPGYKKFMSLEEFTDFCNAAGLINDSFAARETSTCFNIAMMTQVDEIHKRRHLEMGFVEFLEALARGADMANLPPRISEFNQPAPTEEKESSEADERESAPPTQRQEKVDYSKLPLHKKLENAMTYLPGLCPQYQKEPFHPPAYSTFYLYRLPGSSDN